MMRTEGSFTKAPGVVPRPVLSISQRGMTRMGETVFVPTRCTLMRCGMSEPVTKTVCSVTFSFRSGLPLTGASASKALVAISVVTPAVITHFTPQNTPASSRCKSSRKERARCPLAPQPRWLCYDYGSQELGPNTRRSDPSHVYPGFRRFRWN